MVRNRQLDQAFVTLVAICVVGTFEEVPNSRATDIFVCPVHLHEQLNIAGRVLAREGCRRGSVALGHVKVQPPFDYAFDPCHQYA